MKRTAKITLLVVVFFVFTSTVFGAGVAFGWSGQTFVPGTVHAADQPEEFNTFWQAWYIVHRNFIDRDALDTTELTYGAIRGMIEALGDEGHTTFMTPDDFKRERTDITGKFTGIGAQLGMKDGLPIIVAPFDGSPAAEAGVKAGDIILEVDGADVTTWGLDDIVGVIRGEVGTEVVLTVIRPDESESLEIPIVRGEIKIPAVSWTMIPDSTIAMIRLSQFSANANSEMVKALGEAKEAGATGLILDLRNNPGGLLDQAIKITSQFLDSGLVLQQEDAQGNRQTFPVKRGGIATEIPMVVLTNRGSASSSEIFAGAIQDHERGEVVGETTFGTGTILEPFMLNDGSGLLLGTGQWLTAEGRLIRKQGIEPDIEIELPIGSDFLYPGNIEELTLEEILKSEDAQVLKALELLDASFASDSPGV